jgi:ABC-2 type transport system permease protein
MGKFWILFKKEVKDLITIANIAPIVLIFVLFYVMGAIMGAVVTEDDNRVEDADAGDSGARAVRYLRPEIGFIDNDKSEYSEMIKEELNSMGMIALPASSDPTEAMQELENYNFNGEDLKIGALIVIPQGFEASVKAGNYTNVDVYAALESFGLMSMTSVSRWQGAVHEINRMISKKLLANAEITENIYFMTNPVWAREYTYLNNATENVNPMGVLGYVTSQLSFVPIIIMLIILMAASTLAYSMVNEKADKTLETLMTTPISRIAVLLSKIFSAAVYALVYAAVFILAFQRFNNSMTGDGVFSEEFVTALENFGITFGATTFIIVGVQLFLSVLSGLALALIIGMMVDEIKAMQNYIMPLMMFIMIPYFLSMFLDINTLPMAARVAVYAIPFTHSFTAAANLFAQNYALITIGIAYQVVFVAVVLTIGLKIFNSDRLFTLGQMFQKKPGGNKSKNKKGLFSKS